MADMDLTARFAAQDNLSGTIKQMKQAVNDLGNTASNSLDKFTERFQKIEQSSAPLKRQLRDLKAIMAEMNMKGLSNTDEFTKIAKYAGEVKNAMDDAATAAKRFADDTFALKAAAGAFTVVTGAATAATGAMNLFGVKNEEVKNAILRVQSAMAVLNGVQAVANALNKDSALMQGLKALKMKILNEYTKLNTLETNKNTVSEVANKAASEADAVAKGRAAAATVLESGATKKGTIAQNAWNMAKAVAKALLGDFTGLAIVAAGAIATYAMATSDSTDKLEDNNKAVDANSENIKRNKQIHEEWASKVADSAGNQLATYSLLQAKWKECNGDVKLQQKFMKDYKSEIDSLGLGINSLLTAEKAFVSYTDAVVNAIIARAKAEAGKEVYKDEYKKWMHDQMNPTVDNGGAMLRVPKQLDRSNSATGTEMQAYEKATGKRAISGGGGQSSQGYVLTDDALQWITNQRRNTAIDKQRTRDKNYKDRLNFIQENYIKKPLEESEKLIKEAGLGNYSSAVGGNKNPYSKYGGSHGGSHGGSNSGSHGGSNTGKSSDYEEGSIDYYKARNTEIDKELNKSKELKLTEEYVAKLVKEKADNTKKIADLEKKQKDAANALKMDEVNAAKAQEEQKLTIEEKQKLVSEIDELVNKGIPSIQEETDLLKFQAKLMKEIETHKKGIEAKKWLAANDVSGTLPTTNVPKEISGGVKTPNEKLMEYYQNAMNVFSQLQERYNAGMLNKEQFLHDWDVIKELIEEKGLKVNVYPEIQQSQMQKSLDSAADTINTLGGAFSQLGQSTQDMALNAAGTIAQAIANIWLGYSQATAQAASMGPWAWVAFGAAGLAQVIGMVTALKSNSFADGGIVSGSSYSGDRLWARVNAGEMILNGTQQRNLFNAINKNELGGGEAGSSVSFKIKGSDLYGVLKNYGSVKAKTGKNIGIK